MQLVVIGVRHSETRLGEEPGFALLRRWWAGSESVGRLVLRQAGDLHHRPNLDRAPAHPRDASGDLDRLVEICGVDQVVTSELFARLGKRTVGYQPLAVAYADAGRRRRQVKWGGAEILPAGIEVSRDARGLHVALLSLVCVERLLVTVDQQHVFHRDVSLIIRFAWQPNVLPSQGYEGSRPFVQQRDSS